MQPNYTEGVRRMLSAAQTAAARYDHRFVHTEYLLMGLLQERGAATQMLKTLGYDPKALLKTCTARCEHGTHGKDSGLKLTTRAQQIMLLATQEAERQGDGKVRTTHVLVGMLEELDGIAGEVLREAGLTADVVRAAIAQSPKAPEPPAPEPEPHRPNHSHTHAKKPLWKLLRRA
jgi:ATP-dependent Clp protease ATP-binding subunit ClpC